MKKFTSIFVLLVLFGCQVALAQARQISGTVVAAEDGSPIAGATVFAVGTNAGTVTDTEGRYSFRVPETATELEFSFLGYKTVLTAIEGRTTIDVSMISDAVDVDDVVVIAYGTARRSSLTGSAAVVGSKTLERRPVINAASALEGAAAGLQVNSNAAQPGEAPQVRVRGIGSVNGSSNPLYVVDGVAFSGDISTINASDIESITVLKDAASTALFGSRAANGVIMITTKKGRNETFNFNVSINQGFSQRGLPEYETVNAYEYMPLMYQSYRNGLISSGKSPAGAQSYASTLKYNIFNVPANQIVDDNGKLNPNARILPGYQGDLNWYDPLLRTGYRGDYVLTASGGSQKTDYYISMGYTDDNGYVIKSGLERFTGRANVNVQPTSWLKVGLNMSGSITNLNNVTADAGNASNYTNPFFFARTMGPIYPVHVHDATTGDYVYDEFGRKIYDTGEGYPEYGVPSRPKNSGRHVVEEIKLNTDRTRQTSLYAQTYAEITFLKDFRFNIRANVETDNRYKKSYDNKIVGNGNPDGRARRDELARTTYNFQQQLTWTRSFGDHNFDVLAAHENYDYYRDRLYGFKQKQVVDNNDELINFLKPTAVYSYSDKYRTEGYLGRIRYNYDNKYFLDLSYRRDGSSKFAKDKRWGNFWSVGGNWVISRERFMERASWVNMLRVRLSYGEVGNDGGVNLNSSGVPYISYYAWQPLYDIIDGGNATELGAIIQSSYGNPDLVWESSNSVDAAVEFRLWDRFNGSIEFFNRQSSNLLFKVPIALSSGGIIKNDYNSAFVTKNAGTLYNRGWEMQFDVDAIRTRAVTWNIGLNLTAYKNRITKLPPENAKDGIIDGTKRWFKGHSVYEYWLRQWVGVDQMDGSSLYVYDPAQPWSDKDCRVIGGKKYTIEPNKALYAYCGSAIPDVFGSISSSLSWKNFDLSFLFTWSIGGKTYDSAYYTLMQGQVNGTALHKDALKAWNGVPAGMTETSANRIARNGVPRMDNTAYNKLSVSNSSRWLVDASYFNFKNVSLSYNFPARITEKLYVHGLRLTFSGENLGVINKRRGMDVQQAFTGVSYNAYVASRIFTFGLNVTL